MPERFENREDAGKKLGERLKSLAEENPIVLGLARGGIPVAAALARELDAALDALVVRKVASGEDREFGEGAVAPAGIRVVQSDAEPPAGEVERAEKEMRRRIDEYLDGHPAPDIAGRLAILVDDGLATGVTALAAIRYARTLDPARIVMAVPVLSEEALQAVRAEADELVYLEVPNPFHRVEEAYLSFEEVTDGEVHRHLNERHQTDDQAGGSSNR